MTTKSTDNIILEVMQQAISGVNSNIASLGVSIDRQFTQIEKAFERQIAEIKDNQRTHRANCRTLHMDLDKRVDGVSDKVSSMNGFNKGWNLSRKETWLVLGVIAGAGTMVGTFLGPLISFIRGIL